MEIFEFQFQNCSHIRDAALAANLIDEPLVEASQKKRLSGVQLIREFPSTLRLRDVVDNVLEELCCPRLKKKSY